MELMAAKENNSFLVDPQLATRAGAQAVRDHTRSALRSVLPCPAAVVYFFRALLQRL